MKEILDKQSKVKINEESEEGLVDINDVAEIIDKSNLTNTQKIQVIKFVAEKVEKYSGPIPHPNHLEKYEKILSGSANRLICIAENQSVHRQKMENKLIDANIRYKSTGQKFGFIISVLCITGGLAMIFLGKSLEGFATLLGTVAVLVGTFMYSNKDKKK